MAKKFKALIDKMPPDSRERVANETRVLTRQIRFNKLRELRNKTQTEVARSLGVSQASISQIESGQRRLPLPLMARYVDALGGKLVVTARFDDEDIYIPISDEE